MNIKSSLLASLLVLSLPTMLLRAAPDNGSSSPQQAGTSLRYKMISGYKQPFNDDLQLHLSKGWTPVGGVALTVWNNDLYYAQLLSKPASSQ